MEETIVSVAFAIMLAVCQGVLTYQQAQCNGLGLWQSLKLELRKVK
jgi:hypothetical protein